MKKSIVALLVLCCAAGAMAEIVVSWASNGVLVAEGMEPGTACTVEWTSCLTNGFSSDPVPFEGLTADSNGMVRVAVPMFFRISGTPAAEEPSVPEGMVLIPAGTNSGTNPLGDGESYYESNYPETYSLTNETAFFMDATEVTKVQWNTVYNWAIANGYSFAHAGSGKASNHPVQTVSWYDCVKWCNARRDGGADTVLYGQ